MEQLIAFQSSAVTTFQDWPLVVGALGVDSGIIIPAVHRPEIFFSLPFMPMEETDKEDKDEGSNNL
jgi:hypothetical protein